MGSSGSPYTELYEITIFCLTSLCASASSSTPSSRLVGIFIFIHFLTMHTCMSTHTKIETTFGFVFRKWECVCKFFCFFFFCLFAISCTAPSAYGGSQARGRIGAVATGLCQSHSNTGSEPWLQPTPQLTPMPDR